MIRLLPVLLSVLLAEAGVQAQEAVPITTFTIADLEADLASLPLPSAVREDIPGLLEQAARAYDRGSPATAASFLDRFALAVLSLPGNVISSQRAEDLVRHAEFVSGALGARLELGGAFVGSGGAVIEVRDPNSPLYRSRLAIPPGAIARPTFVSISVSARVPANGALAFGGRGLILEPAGLELRQAATLEVPYGDLDQNDRLDGADFPASLLKVGAIDGVGRIAFPRRRIDRERQVQVVELYNFAAYWTVAWRWRPGVLTYKLSWPSEGVRTAPGFDMIALGNAVRSAVDVWASAMEAVGIRFQEVSPSQPAAIRFGFFSSNVPLSVLRSPEAARPGLVPGLARGLGDGAAQVYANENPLSAGEGFVVNFNGDFGSAASLVWTPGHDGAPSAVSIEAVAVHAIGHVLGLDDVPDAVQPPVMATNADLLKPEVCLSHQDIEAFQNLYGSLDPGAFPSCPHAAIDGLPGAFDFGSALTGSEPTETFALRSSGTGTLILHSIVAEGAFEIDATETRTTLRPGESTTFQVRFRPKEPGVSEGLVRILANAADSTVPVRLKGSSPYETPDCTLTPSLSRINAGESLSLIWSATGFPERAEISGIGAVAVGEGRVEIVPDTTTRYTLVVSNQAGTGTCEAVVEVARAASSDPV